MGGDRFQRVRKLFEQVIDLPADERAAVLDAECAGDPELRAEVERLLAQQTSETSPLGAGRQVPILLDADDRPGDAIGPYRLVRLLGEGGMGTVWLAEQSEPVQRQVALKLIKLGMDTRQVVARFESERQALALMSHPNIARVHDAGATESGRPYFVMEYVDGRPITHYCDEKGLPTRQRLALFGQVCEALQHAHQKGIIHRDVKPSNVLVEEVDGRPVPKVIDFGIAKATERRLTERTLYTELGHMVGTPAYMSPEQADPTKVDIDTRTDVYSLGVLLYELLVGVLPFDPQELRGRGYDEILRVIREEDPPSPSSRARALGDTLTELAKSRSTESGRLQRELRGDLDWIVLKALAKEPARRYATASELAAELGRFLADEPVTARPPSRAYQLRKFARRHRALVGGVAATLIVLIGGVAVSTVLALREAKARRDLQVVVDFQDEMLKRVDPAEAGRLLFSDLEERFEVAEQKRGLDEEATEDALAAFRASLAKINATDVAREVLDANIVSPAAEALTEELGDQPAVQSALQHVLGGLYKKLTRYDEAEAMLQASVRTRTELFGPDDAKTLATLNNLAGVYLEQARYEEAAELLEEEVQRAQRAFGADDPRTLRARFNLASVYGNLGRLEEGETLHREVLEARRRVLGPNHPEVMSSLHNLGMNLWRQRKHADAEPFFREALEGKRSSLGPEHRSTLRTMNSLAIILKNLDRRDEAESLHRETLEIRRRALGEEHPATLNSMQNLADFMSRDRMDEKEALLEEILAIRRRVQGEDHPDTLSAKTALANVYMRTDRLEDCARLHAEVLEKKRQIFGEEHVELLLPTNNLGIAYQLVGRADEAEDLFRRQIGLSGRLLGETHRDTQQAKKMLALFFMVEEQFGAAEAIQRPLIEELTETRGAGHGETLAVREALARGLVQQGRLDDAMAEMHRNAESGYTRLDRLEQKPLSRLEGHAGYDELVEAIRSNREGEKEASGG